MKRALQLMILAAASLGAQPSPAAGSWQFSITASGSQPWTATLQVQSAAQVITGTFVTGSGQTFPGFTGTIGGGFFPAVAFTWDPTNRDVPGAANATQAGPLPAVFTGIMTPDGTAMMGTFGTSLQGTLGTWLALYTPSVPKTAITPTTPTVAACTAAVQLLTPTTLILSSLQCTVTPTSATSTNVQFTGDTSQVTLTGTYR